MPLKILAESKLVIHSAGSHDAQTPILFLKHSSFFLYFFIKKKKKNPTFRLREKNISSLDRDLACQWARVNHLANHQQVGSP